MFMRSAVESWALARNRSAPVRALMVSTPTRSLNGYRPRWQRPFRTPSSQLCLIHAASVGVGQAAIQLAQYVGATIFCSVSRTAKRRLIMDQYGIPESHVFSKQAGSLKQGIIGLTNGEGVVLVLNSSTGEALRDGLNCVKKLGTFVELGKGAIQQGSLLSMAAFSRSITFVVFGLAIQPLLPKVFGAINLDKFFASPYLAFFVTLSSIVGVVGKSGQSNYAAGNGFQDAFANAHANHPHTHYVSVNIGVVSVEAHDTLKESQGSEISISSMRAGLRQNSVIDISFEEFFADIEYAMTPLA
ncbi:lovastatin nonaketide synthase [Colletotrichum incanum]|nr:lovastatin nonaketide synthase [Colletotrichum incanum]